MNAIDRPLAGHRIGLFGRGGSGKSTCAVLLAHALADAGYRVCVLDADSTNEGLAQALGADRTPDSLIDWFGGTVFSGGPVTCPVDDPVPLPNANLDLAHLPSEYVARTPDGIMMFSAGKMGPLGPGAGCDGPMTKIARDFAVSSGEPDPKDFELGCPDPDIVTLIDFKAGVEDATRGVVTNLDWALVVVEPSHAAVRMAVTMKNLLAQLHAGHPPATQHLPSQELADLVSQAYQSARINDACYVLNKVPDADTERLLRQQLLEADIHPSATIPEDEGLRDAWLGNTRLRSAPASVEAGKIVKALERMAKDCTLTLT